MTEPTPDPFRESVTEPAEPVELPELVANVEALKAQNDAALQLLAQQGMQLAPGALLGIRMAVLLDAVFGPEVGPEVTRERMAYELACQQQFDAVISGMQKQLRLAILKQGIGQPSAIVPVAQNGNRADRRHPH